MKIVRDTHAQHKDIRNARKLFLSYARGDDCDLFDSELSFVARLHRDLTAHGFDVWFDRVNMPSRRLTFHQEVRAALAACDWLLLVIGPRAVKSEYVRQEWQFAWYEAEKVVTPILRHGELSLLPDELRRLHTEDFRNDVRYLFHIERLIRILNDPIPPLGKLIAVPSLPPNFLSRSKHLVRLRSSLRADLDGPVAIIGPAARVGLYGMGGIGKSVLASALAHDRLIREAFPDGIHWIGLGLRPDVPSLMRRLHQDLGGDGAFNDKHAGREKIKEQLTGKAVLLIFDNVWHREDIDAFDILGQIGGCCRALVTTRDAGLLTAIGGTQHGIDVLTDAEALSLLAQTAGVERDEMTELAEVLIDECGRLPLAVALCGTLIRRGLRWECVLDQLRNARIERIADRHAVEQHHQSVWHAIHVSIEALDSAERERFLELSVFPADETWTETAAATLWEHTDGLDEWDSSELLTSLAERSLVQLNTVDVAESRRFNFHDLIYDYVQCSSGELSARHATLLDAYEHKCPDGWSSGPDDGYFFNHLRIHLIDAGRGSELADLLHELRWLEQKNASGMVFDLLHDFSTAIDSLPFQDPRSIVLRLLDEALRRDIHFIARHSEDYPQALFQCLWNTCWWAGDGGNPESSGDEEYPAARKDDGVELMRSVLEDWRWQKEQATEGFLWLRSLRPPVVAPLGAQIAVLRGHKGDVTAVSHRGGLIASGSSDQTIILWNAKDGTILATLAGHEAPVCGVGMSSDGKRLVSSSNDGTIFVWDIESRTPIRRFQVVDGRGKSKNSENDIAISPEGDRIACGSVYGTQLWDVDSEEETRIDETWTMRVAFSPNGFYIIGSLYSDQACVWDVRQRREVRRFRFRHQGISVATFLRDGDHVACAAGNNSINIRSVSSGTSVGAFEYGIWNSQCLEVLPQDAGLLTVAEDSDVICMWSVPERKNGKVLFRRLGTLEGHEGAVTALSVDPEERTVVSASKDRSIRIWRVNERKSSNPVQHKKDVIDLSFSLSGSHVVSRCQRLDVRVWHVESGREVFALDGQKHFSNSAALSPDGALLATGEIYRVQVWDVRTGEEIQRWTGQAGVGWRATGHYNTIKCISFSPDGKMIVSGSYESSWMWELGSPKGKFVPVSEPTTVTYAPSGDLIAFGYDNGAVTILTSDGKRLKGAYDKYRKSEVLSVRFRNDERAVIFTKQNGDVCLLELDETSSIQTLGQQESAALCAADSNNVERIVSQAGDRTWKTWSVYSSHAHRSFRGVTDPFAAVEGSPCYPWLIISGDRECTVLTPNKKVVAWLPAIFSRITTSPDGRTWAAVAGRSIHLFVLEGADIGI